MSCWKCKRCGYCGKCGECICVTVNPERWGDVIHVVGNATQRTVLKVKAIAGPLIKATLALFLVHCTTVAGPTYVLLEDGGACPDPSPVPDDAGVSNDACAAVCCGLCIHDLQSNLAHCGACDRQCDDDPVSGAAGVCVQGVCHGSITVVQCTM